MKGSDSLRLSSRSAKVGNSARIAVFLAALMVTSVVALGFLAPAAAVTGDDGELGTASIEGTTTDSTFSPLNYASNDGNNAFVDTNGLLVAINDWRNDNIETGELLDVIDLWRSGESLLEVNFEDQDSIGGDAVEVSEAFVSDDVAEEYIVAIEDEDGEILSESGVLSGTETDIEIDGLDLDVEVGDTEEDLTAVLHEVDDGDRGDAFTAAGDRITETATVNVLLEGLFLFNDTETHLDAKIATGETANVTVGVNAVSEVDINGTITLVDTDGDEIEQRDVGPAKDEELFVEEFELDASALEAGENLTYTAVVETEETPEVVESREGTILVQGLSLSEQALGENNGDDAIIVEEVHAEENQTIEVLDSDDEVVGSTELSENVSNESVPVEVETDAGEHTASLLDEEDEEVTADDGDIYAAALTFSEQAYQSSTDELTVETADLLDGDANDTTFTVDVHPTDENGTIVPDEAVGQSGNLTGSNANVTVELDEELTASDDYVAMVHLGESGEPLSTPALVAAADGELSPVVAGAPVNIVEGETGELVAPESGERLTNITASTTIEAAMVLPEDENEVDIEARYIFDGEQEDSETVTLGPGEEEDVEFTFELPGSTTAGEEMVEHSIETDETEASANLTLENPIQTAVDYANMTGADTVDVEDGEYEESVLVGDYENLDGLTIESQEGAEETTLTAADDRALEVDASNVTVDGFTIDATTRGVDVGTDATGVTVTNNVFVDADTSAEDSDLNAVFLQNDADDAVIENNEFADLNVGIVTPGAFDATVSENHFSETDIGVNVAATGNSPAGWDIDENEFEETTAAIRFFAPVLEIDLDEFTANHNNFAGNNTYGVLLNETEDITGELDATHNWWGDMSGPSGEGPGIGDAVDVQVDFEPWLDAPYPEGEPIMDRDWEVRNLDGDNAGDRGEMIQLNATVENNYQSVTEDEEPGREVEARHILSLSDGSSEELGTQNITVFPGDETRVNFTSQLPASEDFGDDPDAEHRIRVEGEFRGKDLNVSQGFGDIAGTVTASGETTIEDTPGTGEGIENATLEVYTFEDNLSNDSGNATMTTTTDEDGNYAFEDLPFGEHFMTVEADNFTGEERVVVPETNGVATEDFALNYSEPGSISGNLHLDVVDPAEDVNATVAANDSDFTKETSVLIPGEEDSGNYTLEDMPVNVDDGYTMTGDAPFYLPDTLGETGPPSETDDDQIRYALEDGSGTTVTNEVGPDGTIEAADYEWVSPGASATDNDYALRLTDDGGVNPNQQLEFNSTVSIDMYWRYADSEIDSDLAYMWNDQDSTSTGFRAFTGGSADTGLIVRAGDLPGQSSDITVNQNLHDGEWYNIRVVLDAEEAETVVYIDGQEVGQEDGYDGSFTSDEDTFRAMGKMNGEDIEIEYDAYRWTSEALPGGNITDQVWVDVGQDVEDVNLSLERETGDINGTVTASGETTIEDTPAPGDGIEDATVTVYGFGNDTATDAYWSTEVETDEDGNYEIEDVPVTTVSTHVVEVEADDFTTTKETEVEVDADETTTEDFALDYGEAGTFTGDVELDTVDPAEDVDVTVTVSEDNETVTEETVWVNGSADSTTYEIEDVPVSVVDAYDVTFEADSYTGDSFESTVDVGETVEEDALLERETGEIDGTVTASIEGASPDNLDPIGDGDPIENATVELYAFDDNTTVTPVASTETDEDGMYAFEDVPVTTESEHFVFASATGFPGDGENATVATNETTTVDLELDADAVEIVGNATLSHGAPSDDFQIKYTLEKPDDTTRTSTVNVSEGTRDVTTVTWSGLDALDDNEDERFTLTAEAQGYDEDVAEDIYVYPGESEEVDVFLDAQDVNAEVDVELQPGAPSEDFEVNLELTGPEDSGSTSLIVQENSTSAGTHTFDNKAPLEIADDETYRLVVTAEDIDGTEGYQEFNESRYIAPGDTEFFDVLVGGSVQIGDEYFLTIQDAVDAAEPGDTIDVAEGTFEEDVTMDTTDVTLNGTAVDETTIVGNVTVEGDENTIQDLTIEGDYTDEGTDNELNNVVVTSSSPGGVATLAGSYSTLDGVSTEAVSVEGNNISVQDSDVGQATVTDTGEFISFNTVEAVNATVAGEYVAFDYSVVGTPDANGVIDLEDGASLVNFVDSEVFADESAIVVRDGALPADDDDRRAAVREILSTNTITEGVTLAEDLGAQALIEGSVTDQQVVVDEGVFVDEPSIDGGTDFVDADDDSVEVTEGTYEEDVTVSVEDLTVQAVGDATLDGSMSIDADGVTIDGFTIISQQDLGVAVSGDATLQDNTFDGLDTAVEILSGEVTVENNEFTDSDTGLEWSSGSQQDADASSITDNDFDGNDVGLLLSADVDLDATENYWGDDSGPSGVGPGDGDAIVEDDGEVEFAPWLNADGEVLVGDIDGSVIASGETATEGTPGTDEGIEDAEVEVYLYQDDDSGEADFEATTDSDGEFDFTDVPISVEDGDHHVNVTAEDFAPVGQQIEVDHDETTDVVVDMDYAEAGSISGELELDVSDPDEDVDILITADDGEGGEFQVTNVLTGDADSYTYTLDGVDVNVDDGYTVTAEITNDAEENYEDSDPAEYEEVEVDVGEDTDGNDFSFDRTTGDVDGTVTASGETVDNTPGEGEDVEATVELYLFQDDDDGDADFETTQTGEYNLDDVPVSGDGDDHHISVTADDFAPADAQIAVDEGETTTEDFALDYAEGGSISGTVTASGDTAESPEAVPGGDPIEGLDVTLTDLNDGSEVTTETTDADGEYEFEDVDVNVDDGYEIEVDGDDEYVTETEETEVDVGDELTFDFEMDYAEAGSISGTVTASGDAASPDGDTVPGGEPIEGLDVTLTDLNDNSEVGTDTTDADGEYEFEDVDVNVDEGYEVEVDGGDNYNDASEETEVDVGEDVEDFDFEMDYAEEQTLSEDFSTEDVDLGQSSTTQTLGDSEPLDIDFDRDDVDSAKVVFDGDELPDDVSELVQNVDIDDGDIENADVDFTTISPNTFEITLENIDDEVVTINELNLEYDTTDFTDELSDVSYEVDLEEVMVNDADITNAEPVDTDTFDMVNPEQNFNVEGGVFTEDIPLGEDSVSQEVTDEGTDNRLQIEPNRDDVDEVSITFDLNDLETENVDLSEARVDIEDDDVFGASVNQFETDSASGDLDDGEARVTFEDFTTGDNVFSIDGMTFEELNTSNADPGSDLSYEVDFESVTAASEDVTNSGGAVNTDEFDITGALSESLDVEFEGDGNSQEEDLIVEEYTLDDRGDDAEFKFVEISIAAPQDDPDREINFDFPSDDREDDIVAPDGTTGAIEVDGSNVNIDDVVQGGTSPGELSFMRLELESTATATAGGDGIEFNTQDDALEIDDAVADTAEFTLELREDDGTSSGELIDATDRATDTLDYDTTAV